jgi:hypothetical protein
MPFIVSREALPLVFQAQNTLVMSQAQLGALLGISRRTVIRWATRSRPSTEQVITLAKAVYPKDRDLAAALAQAAGTRLDEIGLEAPPSPVVAAPSAATVEVMVDSIVCAAATAGSTTPQVARATLLAALDRAAALGVSPSDLRVALRGPAASAT